jgi:hypothetical protein
MKKAIIIASITLFAFTCAFIYANSEKIADKPSVSSLVNDSTQVKPCVHQGDSATCAHSQNKCHKHEGCKKDSTSSCCKKK